MRSTWQWAVVDYAAQYVDERRAAGKGSRRMSVDIERMHVPVAEEHKTLGVKEFRMAGEQRQSGLWRASAR